MIFLRTVIFSIWVFTAIFNEAKGSSLDFHGNLCDESQVMLAFSLDSFDSAVTWSRSGLANPIGCSSNRCTLRTASIEGNIYSFNANASGAYVTFQITIKDYGVEWICNFNFTNYKYLITDDSCGSTSTQSPFGIPCWVWILIAVFVISIMYVIYRCSNKNCKTHAKCWKCSWMCYSDYPLVTADSSEEWNIEHYCCLNPCCHIEGCNKICCSFFLCLGCCLNEYPAKRIKENNQPLTSPTERRKKKKKAKHSAKENNDESNHPVEKHTKEEKAVHTATVNNTKTEPNPPGDRRISLDSLNSKSNKIHPEEAKQVNNTKILDPIMLKSGNVELTLSSTPRPLPVLPPIDKKTS